MRKSLLVLSAYIAVAPVAALAGDLAPHYSSPVYEPPFLFAWTGPYAGAQIGYQFGRDLNIDGLQSHIGGIAGGVHAGYNYQFLTNFVIGIEGDAEGSGAKSANASAAGVLDFYRESVQGSFRGRFGFAAERALFYATGGVALANLKNHYFGAGSTDSSGHTVTGYTVGAGLDYAVTDVWSVRVEYRYTDFGYYPDVLTNTEAGYAFGHRDTDNKFELGFNYKFGVTAPVIARY